MSISHELDRGALLCSARPSLRSTGQSSWLKDTSVAKSGDRAEQAACGTAAMLAQHPPGRRAGRRPAQASVREGARRSARLRSRGPQAATGTPSWPICTASAWRRRPPVSGSPNSRPAPLSDGCGVPSDSSAGARCGRPGGGGRRGGGGGGGGGGGEGERGGGGGRGGRREGGGGGGGGKGGGGEGEGRGEGGEGRGGRGGGEERGGEGRGGGERGEGEEGGRKGEDEGQF